MIIRILIALAVFLAAGRVSGPPGESRAPGRRTGDRSQPIDAPVDEAAAHTLAAEIGQEIQTLKTEGASYKKADDAAASDAEKESAKALTELIDRLTVYHTLLKDYASVISQLRAVNAAENVERQADELATLQRRAGDLRESLDDPKLTVTPEEVDRAEREWQVANDEMTNEAVARSEGLHRLAGLTGQRGSESGEAQDALNKLASEAADHGTKIASAADESEAAVAQYRLQTTQVNASLPLLQDAYLEARIELDTRLAENAEQRLPLLREVASLLDDRCERLRRIQTRNERQQIRDMVDIAAEHPERVSAFEKVYWPLRLAMNDAQFEVRRIRDESGIADRFPEDKYADLTSDLAVEQAIWNRFVGSLDRRPQEQIFHRYFEALALIRKWQSRREQIRILNDTSFDNQARMELRLSAMEDALRIQIREARAVADAHPNDPKTAEHRRELGLQMQALDQDSRALSGELKQLIDRLSEASRAVAAHIEELSSNRVRIYWAFITVADVPFWKYRWSRSAEEWDDPTRRQKRTQDVTALAQSVSRVSSADWVIFAGTTLVAFFGGIRFRIRANSGARRLEARLTEESRDAQDGPLPLTDRLGLHGMRLAGRLAPVIFPAISVWICTNLSPANSRMIVVPLLFVGFASIAHALIAFGFGGLDPRLRLISCSDEVADYFRHWLRGVLWFTVVILPVPVFWFAMEWAFYSPMYVWAFYKTVVMSLMLWFLSRKALVLGVVGLSAGERPAARAAIICTLYPVLVCLGVVIPLVIQLIGYGALNTYLMAGLGATAVLFLVSPPLLKCFTELMDRLQTRLEIQAPGANAEKTGVNVLRGARSTDDPKTELVESPQADRGAGMPVGLILSLLRLVVWSGAVILIGWAWGFTWAELRGWIDKDLVAAAGDRPAITVGRAVLAVVTVLGSWIASRSLRTILDAKVYPTYAQLDRGGRIAVNTVLHYMLLLIGLYFAMFLLRIPLGAVTVVLGTLGLGLGLASQPLFMNFLSGLIMLFERHVKVGDIVDIEGNLGEVTNISIRATTIKTFDNVDMIIPNAEFVGSKVVNWTLKDEQIRGKVPVGVAYGAEPRVVERLLLQVADESPLVLRNPPPRVRFLNFGESSLDFALYAWFKNVSDRWDFITDSRFRIFDLLQQHGIEIPFPQRTMNLKEDHPIRVQVITEEQRTLSPPPERNRGVRPVKAGDMHVD